MRGILQRRRNLQVISQQTPVRLGLILTIITIGAGTVVSSAVWVSNKINELNFKVDALNAAMLGIGRTESIMQLRVSEHETSDLKMWNQIESRVQMLERNGSQLARDTEKKIESMDATIKTYQDSRTEIVRNLTQQIAELRNEVLVHYARTEGAKPNNPK